MDNDYWNWKIEIIDDLINKYVSNHNIEIETGDSIKITGLFKSGSIVMTRSVHAWIEEDNEDEPLRTEYKRKWVNLCLFRHFVGDWGIQCMDDFNENEFSLMTDGRIMSVYEFDKNVSSRCDGQKIWIITEWDRSATTVLLPNDY